MIPYSRQYIQEDDIESVVEVLRSPWLTTGPKVEEFERAFARAVGAEEAVAVSSGTAALHAAMYALGIGAGDEVIVPAMTFAASVNCVVYQGGTPVFVDVDPETLLIDLKDVEQKITSRTSAIIAVDYAGQPCDYDNLRDITDKKGIKLVGDACHALGAEYKGKKVGSLTDMTVFSFHPVKHITTGEGGMITTDDPEQADRLRLFRNHGMSTGFREREQQGSWYYEIIDLGYNYRITDIQCALGVSQLRKLPIFLKRRREIAAQYDCTFSSVEEINPVAVREDVTHAYHLYVVKIDFESIGRDRQTLFRKLQERDIGVNVHYIPVHLHPFYQKKFGTGPGLCPQAEAAYEQILSLPVHPGMTDKEVEVIHTALKDAISC